MSDIKFVVDGYSVKILEGPYLRDGAPTPAAHAFARSLVDRLPEFKTRASNQLLDLYNEVWLDDAIGVLSADAFQSNLTNPAIVIYDAPESAMIHFSDSNMFAGHYVEVACLGNQVHVNLVG